MSHGDYDDFWKDHGSSVVDHLTEYKDVPEYHTTGWYDSWGTPVANLNFVELRKAKKSLQRLIVGPWIHSSEDHQLCRRGPVHRRRGARPCCVSSALVRPLAEGNRQRRGPRTACPNLRDGRRRCAQNAGRPSVRRRPLARRTGVAAGARRGDALLSGPERRPLAGEAGRGRAGHLHVRSAEPGSHTGRQCLFPGHPHVPGRGGPALPHRLLVVHRYQAALRRATTYWCSRLRPSPPISKLPAG